MNFRRQFSLKSLFIVVTVIGLIAGVIAWIPYESTRFATMILLAWFSIGTAIGAGIGAWFKQVLLGALIGFCLSAVILAAMLPKVQ